MMLVITKFTEFSMRNYSNSKVITSLSALNAVAVVVSIVVGVATHLPITKLRMCVL